MGRSGNGVCLWIYVGALSGGVHQAFSFPDIFEQQDFLIGSKHFRAALALFLEFPSQGCGY
jgi:hypothetical protein